MTNQTTKNKSFVLHTESLEVLGELSDQQAGKLFKAIYNYQKAGDYGKLDQTLKFIINPLINQFKRDEEKYQTSIIAGKLGNLKKYHKKIYQRIIDGEITLENGEKLAYPERSIKSTSLRPPITPDQAGSHNIHISISDNININDDINVNIKDSEIEELAEGLKFVLEAKLNRKLNTNSWKKEIKLLVEKDLAQRASAVEDVKRVIQEISNRFGDQYFPAVQSASSLREKFSKVEAAIARNQPKPSIESNYFNLKKEFENE
ncbi:MAG: hypothetical protein FJ368_04120 [Pelagibacterales bacterium]|nr:hypothetical protein [Pelagibacterales bacterium]